MNGSSGSRHNYPSREGSPNITISYVPQIENNIKRFVLTDDIRDWQSIPKILHDYGHSTKRGIVVPYCPYGEDQFKNFTAHSRRLYLNNQNEQTAEMSSTRGVLKPIPINRPSGMEAYIHSITWQAFDFNEPLPYVDTAAIIAILQQTIPAANESDLMVADAFGTGLHGIMIAITDTSGNLTPLYDWVRSTQFTTANFPDMAVNFSGDHNKFIADNVKIMERLSEAAPRTNTMKGMIPTDWNINNFSLTIGGYENSGLAVPSQISFLDALVANSYLYDSKGRNVSIDNPDNQTFENWSNTDFESYGVGLDYPIPLITNVVNKLIPTGVDFLLVDTEGPGWYHWLEVAGSTNSAKGLAATDKHFRTLVQMPVRVIIDVLYN